MSILLQSEMLFASNNLQVIIMPNNAVCSVQKIFCVHSDVALCLFLYLKHLDWFTFIFKMWSGEREVVDFVFIYKHFRLQSKRRPAIMLISCLGTQLTIWVLLRLNSMPATQQFEVWELDGFNKQHCQHPRDTGGHFWVDFTFRRRSGPRWIYLVARRVLFKHECCTRLLLSLSIKDLHGWIQ